jgi:1-deoxy-D-xylulose-5-phosphate reductoisomerase
VQAVALFLEEKIHYLEIMKVVEACCEAHKKDFTKMPSLDEIVAADAWSRKWVEAHVSSGTHSKLVVAA